MEKRLVSDGSEEDDDISALWNAAISRQEFERSTSEVQTNFGTPLPARQKSRQSLLSPQEMNFICLNGRIQSSRDVADEDEDYDYHWNKDDELSFSEKVERGGRIDCWLGFEAEGIISTIHYQSYLTGETEPGDPLVILGAWKWHRESCKPPGGYDIVRNFWGEKEGIPEIREAIKNGYFDDKDEEDEGELGSEWAQLALAAFEDKSE